MADVFEVQGEGDDDLARFFDLTLQGTLVSLHLAAREGVDPGPVPVVEEAQAGGLVPLARRRRIDLAPAADFGDRRGRRRARG